MKLSLVPALVSLCIAVPFAARAAGETKPQPPAAEPSPADAAWAEIEKALRGPSEAPKSREEAIAIMKAHLLRLDGTAAEFSKTYPNDPRRWKITLAVVDNHRIRQMVGLPEKTNADSRAALAEILAAPDADAETKSFASYNAVILIGDDAKAGKATLEDLEKAVEAHRKAYPDFKNNSQLDRLIAVVKTEVDVKGMPITLKFTAVDGREVDLSKMVGKVVLVDFWATWCGPCVGEIPNVVKAYEKLHDKGFEIVGISFDQDKAKLESMTKEKGMTWPQFFDGKGWENEFGKKFGINSIPRMWLVNKKGFVVDTNGRDNLAIKVERLLAE